MGRIGPAARVGFVAGEFWWLPSFAGGVCHGRLESVSCLDGHLFTLSWFVPKPLEGSNRAGEADIEGVPYRKKAAHGDRRRGSQKTPSRQATHVHQKEDG